MIKRLIKTGWILSFGVLLIALPLWLPLWIITGISWYDAVGYVCDQIDEP